MSETETLPSVQRAWADVMADVRELGKDQRHDAPGAKFNFRGVDDVMNAVGPILRKHKVSVVPTQVDLRHRDVQTSSGKPSREATVVVQYAIHGPAGDTMPGGSAGEAMDSGDKGTAKAMSVAYRVFLLQSLCLPTHDTDPDHYAYERGNAEPAESPRDVALRGIANAQDRATLAQIKQWADQQNIDVSAELVRRENELVGA